MCNLNQLVMLETPGEEFNTEITFSLDIPGVTPR